MSFYHFYHIKKLAKFVKFTFKKKLWNFFKEKSLILMMPLHNLSIKIRNKKYKISKFDPNKKLRLNLRWLIYVHIKKKDNNNVEKKLFL
jgi:hypothetical protein